MLTCIRNIPENHALVTDSQDVQAVLTSIGKLELYDEGYTGLFVLESEGEYTSVYAFVGSVPYLSKLATKIL